MDHIAPLVATGLTVALIGWVILYLASSPRYPNEDERRAARSRFRRWLAATHKQICIAAITTTRSAAEPPPAMSSAPIQICVANSDPKPTNEN
jgi:hypothetical protein